MARKKRNNKGFVCYAPRIGFYSFLTLYQLMFLPLFWSLHPLTKSLLMLLVAAFTTVNAIIHLTQYKEKGLAITALIITALFSILILFQIGLNLGIDSIGG